MVEHVTHCANTWDLARAGTDAGSHLPPARSSGTPASIEKRRMAVSTVARTHFRSGRGTRRTRSTTPAPRTVARRTGRDDRTGNGSGLLSRAHRAGGESLYAIHLGT